ncbi:hypothetical protein L1049_007779 [Liquidambar formosana]|uniref:Large ribosomal subunit protein uL15/eL18 domain-containing protein n=1 Tax=Liquidambar formosana TaxID=63359 RepID=A0AAP0S8T9_LIQFO
MMTCFKNHRNKRGKVSAGHGHIGKHRKHPGSRGNCRRDSPPLDLVRQVPSKDLKDKASKDNILMIDITQFGYFKVLGEGVLPNSQPIVVKAKLVSKIAKKKITEAGGVVVLTA